ncbi:MAG: 6-bladed beta-propeller [Gammaproteobacteria bacterium]|nr:6-bladed beta-propeller [Gammaproteobacteria bacterium]
MMRLVHVHLAGAGLGLVVLLNGCAAPEREPAGEARQLVFPPPPEQGRYVFERSLFSTANLKVDDSTSRLRRLVTGEATTGRGFGKPFDVVACKGRIYVSDTVERVVMTFDVTARRFFEIGAEEPHNLLQPLGLNVDRACNLYVADTTARKIMVYDRDGGFITSLGGPDQFRRLSHVAVTADGSKVFAVDTGGIDSNQHHVRVFDVRSGQHLYDIGKRGAGPGEFNLPRDAEVGGDGLLYVVDGANFRVQVFEQGGGLVRTFGAVGRQTGQFSRPKGIALDSENRVYVSDTAFGNFQIFTPDGKLLLFIGSRGAQPEPARYMLPAGIDVDEDGRVLMVDQYFNKVDIYRPLSMAASDGFLGAWEQGARPN